MGNQLIKPVREDDFYVLWSSITDEPFFWGDEVEVTEEMARPVRGRYLPTEDDIANRLVRVNEYGSTAYPLGDGWDEPHVRYQANTMVTRANIRELCRRLDKHRGEESYPPPPDIAELLIPIHDEDQED